MDGKSRFSTPGVDVLHSYGLCSDHFHDTSYLPRDKKQPSVNALPEISHEPSRSTEEKYDPALTECKQLCRTCACESEEVISVFGEEGKDLQLLEKIHLHLPLLVTPEDMLPVMVCPSCVWKLCMCHEFVVNCVEADAKLRRILGLESVGEESQYDQNTNADTSEDISKSSDQTCFESTFSEPSSVHTDDNTYRKEFDKILSSYLDCESADHINAEDAFTSISKPSLSSTELDPSEKLPEGLSTQNDAFSILECLTNINLENNIVLTNLKMIQENPKFKVVVVKCNRTADNSVQDAKSPEGIRESSSGQQGSSTLRISDITLTNNLLTPTSLLNLPVMPTLIPTSTEVKPKLKNSVKVLSLRTQGGTTDKKEPSVNPPVVEIAKKGYDESRISDDSKIKSEPIMTHARNIIQGNSCINSPIAAVKKNSSKTTNSNKCLPEKVTVSVADMSEADSPKCPLTGITSKNNKATLKSADNATTLELIRTCTGNVTKADSAAEIVEKNYIESINISKDCDVSPTEKKNSNKSSAMQPVVLLKRLRLFPDLYESSIKNAKCRKELVDTNASDSSKSSRSAKKRKIVENELENIIEDFGKENAMDVVPEQGELNQEIELCNGIKEPELENISDAISNMYVDVDNIIDKNNASMLTESIDNMIELSEDLFLETTRMKAETSTGLIIEEVMKMEENGIMSQMNLQRKTQTFWKCSQCHDIFVSENLLDGHIQEKHPTIHQCEHCGQQFDNVNQYESHLTSHKGRKDFMCEVCGKSFLLKQSLHRHLKSHGDTKDRFSCGECGKSFPTKRRYDTHSFSHGKASFLCDVCGRSMKHFTNLKAHRKACVDPSSISYHKCTFCEKQYRDKRAFENHLRLHTNERPYKCEKCGESFRIKIQLTYHTFRHNNTRQHKCTVCGRGFYRQQHLRVHILVHQRSTKYMCNVCSQTFTYMKDLNLHRQTHSREEIHLASRKEENDKGKFTCEICGKHLANTLTLKNHMVIHSEVKPFLCKTCGKCFSTKSKLHIHERIHTNIKPYSCNTCGKSFLLKTHLQTHQQVHTKEKPFQCRYCNVRYSFKQNLIYHERMHTGERPFKCTVCGNEYASKNSLKAHALVHSDTRPFSCSCCEKSFKRQDILNAHMRTHTGERPFKCNICGQAFKQNGDCKKHEQTHMRKVIEELLP